MPIQRSPTRLTLACAILAAAAAGSLPLAPQVAASNEAAGTEIARGNTLYEQAKLAEARDAYRVAIAAEPGNFDALCRIAQVESDLGEDARGDEQMKLAADAVEHARAAVRAAPDSARGHVWLAVALGRQALKMGAKQRLALSREIKSEADRAIAIDPRIGRAYHVRAIWNRKLASLNAFERMAANVVLGGVPKGASMENAVRDLEQAITLEPGYVNHHLELGRTFMMLHRDSEARRELDQALSLAPTSNPRDAKYQADARELLKKLRR